MSLLKRLTLAVSSSVERLVGEIENHDAVVEAGIRESRRLYARAAVRHTRLRAEGERLCARRDGLKRDAIAWRERARTATDEEQALECLRRAKHAAEQAQSLDRACARHVALEQRLADEIARQRQRVADLEHRRQLMRSREATADAATGIRDAEDGASLDLDGAFERWEVKVTEAEIEYDAVAPVDAFAAGFVAEEERAALRAELAALKADPADRPESRHEA
jgi:phage shock protein A